MRRGSVAFGFTSLFLLIGAEARADGPQRLPNVLIVLDTAGAMQFEPSADTIPTGTTRSRWGLVAEALTGTIRNYSTDSAGYVRSNRCRAQQNTIDSWFGSAFVHPWDWPVHSTKPLDQRDPIIFVRAQGDDGHEGDDDHDYNQYDDDKNGKSGSSNGNSGSSNGNSGSSCGNNRHDDDEDHDNGHGHGSSSSTSGASCVVGPGGWDQSNDGVLDVFGRQIRFALMTSDTGHLEGVDLQSASFSDWLPSGAQPVSTGGSYWYVDAGNNWLKGQGFATGSYGQMTASKQPWEIGSRNPYVAPWDGRLMGFGPPSAAVDDVATQNDRIQRVILSRHPLAYGTDSTAIGPGDMAPMAAMLSDAYDFLTKDGTSLPDYPAAGQSFLMSSATDPAFLGGCRSTTVVVISDGRFGGDMRNPATDGYQSSWFKKGSPPASCASGGTCPYMPAEYYANKLATNPGNPIPVHFFGVVSKHTAVRWKSMPGNCPAKGTAQGAHCDMSCESLTASDFGPAGSVGKMCSGSSGAWDHDGDPSGDKKGVVAACCELAKLAIQVDPAKPPLSFIDNADSLKQALTAIVGTSTTEDTSRTVPAITVAAPTIEKGQNPTETGPGGASIPAAEFELLSSLSVGHSAWAPGGAQNPSPMWRGFLERRRVSCSNASSPVPVAATIDPARGDDFAQNLVNGYAKRKFFTVVASDGTNPQVTQTLRRNDYDSSIATTDPNSDGLSAIDVSLSSNQSTLTTSDDWYNQIAARLTGSVKPETVLGIGSSSSTACVAQLGASSTKDCANLTLRWYGGYRNHIEGHPSDRCPNSACSWVPADYTNQNPLGAIYHSTPVVVGPPLEFSRDESYRTSFAVAPDSAHPNGQATRPTMLYSATIDGMLHAFVVAKNSVPGDLLYGNVPRPDGVDNSGNNELWSFVPPAILGDVWANFGSHSVLLDGPIVVRDTILRRSAADVQAGNGKWKTVLVGSSGASTEGGFYYALDVTNPTKPEFLWQLRTAGTTPVRLFGSSVPAAEITTVGVKTISGKVDQVAVAILSGGTADKAPPSDPAKDVRATRRCSSCNTSGVRSQIREWGDSVPARSLTVVELATGKVIKRFEGRVGTAGSPGDLPTSNASLVSALASVRSDTRPLDSPMTGTPVAFPSTPGVNAERAYVGDADGTMWRLDLHDSDPSKWSVDIAFDAYGALSGSAGALAGQPVVVAPVASVDALGNPAVIYATGDQDGFQTYSKGMQSALVTFLDKSDGKGGFAPVESFHLATLLDGERVTGPLTLFDGRLYFATYAPADPSLAICASGTPKVWGINFLSGAAALDTDSTPGPDARFVTFDSKSVIFGVQLSRTPSCYASETTSSDSWFAGNYSVGTKRSAGSYQLVLQTGRADGFSTALGADDLLTGGQQGATTKSLHVNLDPPKSITKVVSWAAVIE